MRRISYNDCLTKNASSALKYSISTLSTLLVALLFLSLGPSATFAQIDPFAEKKPAGANPFADVSPSDANHQVQNQPETPDAPRASANPFDELPEGSDQKGSDQKGSDLKGSDLKGSDQKDNTEAVGSDTT